MKYEILRKKADSKRYQDLSKSLGFNDIKTMTGISIKEDNTAALMGLARSNIYAVTAELRKPKYTHYFSEKHQKHQDTFIPELYFMIRSHAPLPLKILLQRLTRSIILRTSLNISGRGSKGRTRRRIRYYPGISEFDLDSTLENYIQNGQQYLTFNDIVGYERRQRKRSVVLMLDTSGSMFGNLLLNAALTTSVLSYAMSKDFTSIVLFNSESLVIKEIRNEREKVTDLIDKILESEAMGFTNITKALHTGLKELKKISGNQRKIGILITDGDYNRGKHPERIAKLFPTLHVIHMPPEKGREKQQRGIRICQKLAHFGRGYFIPVKEIAEIPRALMTLLGKI